MVSSGIARRARRNQAANYIRIFPTRARSSAGLEYCPPKAGVARSNRVGRASLPSSRSARAGLRDGREARAHLRLEFGHPALQAAAHFGIRRDAILAEPVEQSVDPAWIDLARLRDAKLRVRRRPGVLVVGEQLLEELLAGTQPRVDDADLVFRELRQADHVARE